MFYKLKFVNENNLSIEFKAEKKGDTFVQLEDNAPTRFQGYKLIEFEDDMKADVRLQKSYNQDGGTHLETSLGSRFPYLEFIIIAKDYDELSRLRRHAVKVFNPKLVVDIIKSQGRNIEKLTVIPEAVANFGSEDAAGRTQIGTVSMVSPSSYWKSNVVYREEIATWRGAWEFPWEILEEGIELGYREPSLIVNVLNKGDAPCGMRIQFKALATVENPSLFNVNTREFFKINRIMEAGEVITVNTQFQNKRVELNKNGVISNAFNWIDFQSTFLQLDVEDNLFRYDADEGIDNLEVSIWYTPQYLGV